MKRIFFFTLLLSAPALAGELPVGKVKLVGQYETSRQKEANRQKTYFILEQGQVMRLKAGGPTSFVILARSKRRAKVGFELKLGADKSGEVTLAVLPKPSRGFFVNVPA